MTAEQFAKFAAIIPIRATAAQIANFKKDASAKLHKFLKEQEAYRAMSIRKAREILFQ